MSTIEQILAEVGLSEAPSTQTKTAAAAPSTSEVNQVLENLGLSGGVDAANNSEVTKTASAERNPMGLTDIYEDLFSDEAPAAEAAATAEGEEQTKVAAAEPTTETPAEGDGEPTTMMGELVGVYFNVLQDAWTEKVAGDLESEAGAGHKPQAGIKDGGELSRIVGKEGDPAVAKNHDASSGAPLKVMTGSNSPYTLKEKALQKAILKRNAGSIAVGGFHE